MNVVGSIHDAIIGRTRREIDGQWKRRARVLRSASVLSIALVVFSCDDGATTTETSNSSVTERALSWTIAGCKPFLVGRVPKCFRSQKAVRLWFDVDRYALLKATLNGAPQQGWSPAQEQWQLDVADPGLLEVREPNAGLSMRVEIVDGPWHPGPPLPSFAAESELSLAQARNLLFYADPAPETPGSDALDDDKRLVLLKAAERAFLENDAGYEAAVARDRRIWILHTRSDLNSALSLAQQDVPKSPAIESELYILLSRTRLLKDTARSSEALRVGSEAFDLALRAGDERILALLLGPLLDMLVRSKNPKKTVARMKSLLALVERLTGKIRAQALMDLGWWVFLARERFPDLPIGVDLDERALTERALEAMESDDSNRAIALVNLGLYAGYRRDATGVDAALHELSSLPVQKMMVPWVNLLRVQQMWLTPDAREGTQAEALSAVAPLIDGQQGPELAWRAGIVRGQVFERAGRLQAALRDFKAATLAARAWLREVDVGAPAIHFSHHLRASTDGVLRILLKTSQTQQAFEFARSDRRAILTGWTPATNSSAYPTRPARDTAWLLVRRIDDAEWAFAQVGDQISSFRLPPSATPTQRVQRAVDQLRADLPTIRELQLLSTPETVGWQPPKLRYPASGRLLLKTHRLASKLDLPIVQRPETPQDPTLIVADTDRVPNATEPVQDAIDRLKMRGIRIARWPIGLGESAPATPDNFAPNLAPDLPVDLIQRLVTADLFLFIGHGRPSALADDAGIQLPGDRWLNSRDVIRLVRGPRQVVLLACHSSGTPAEASVGLSHAFLMSGSEAVIASRRLLSVSTASLWLDALTNQTGPLTKRWAKTARQLLRTNRASDVEGVQVMVR